MNVYYMHDVGAWASVCEVVESLDAQDELPSEERAFLLLYSSLGLQLLSPTEREKTADSIEVGRDQCTPHWRGADGGQRFLKSRGTSAANVH